MFFDYNLYYHILYGTCIPSPPFCCEKKKRDVDCLFFTSHMRSYLYLQQLDSHQKMSVSQFLLLLSWHNFTLCGKNHLLVFFPFFAFCVFSKKKKRMFQAESAQNIDMFFNESANLKHISCKDCVIISHARRIEPAFSKHHCAVLILLAGKLKQKLNRKLLAVVKYGD